MKINWTKVFNFQYIIDEFCRIFGNTSSLYDCPVCSEFVQQNETQCQNCKTLIKWE
jgi:hypothetical protein